MYENCQNIQFALLNMILKIDIFKRCRSLKLHDMFWSSVDVRGETNEQPPQTFQDTQIRPLMAPIIARGRLDAS